MNEVKIYILTGFKYAALLPIMYSFGRKPGLKRRIFKVEKNLPSKWVTSLKK
jgi:hypothetical protein